MALAFLNLLSGVSRMVSESDFVKCGDYEQLPVGTYLVRIADTSRRGNLHIAAVSENNQGQKMVIVGGHFSFDRKPLIGYIDITHLQGLGNEQ